MVSSMVKRGVGGVKCDLPDNCDICDRSNMLVLKGEECSNDLLNYKVTEIMCLKVIGYSNHLANGQHLLFE